MNSFIQPDLQKFAVPLSTLKLDPRNSRVHPAENLEDIKLSLMKFGQDQLIVYRKDTKEIIKGNGRWLAMQALGWEECAAMGVDDDSVAAMARSIADNHSSDSSGFDDALLAAQLKELLDTEYADATGFDADEIDRMLQDFVEETEEEAAARDEADETKVDELKAKWGTEVGQLWRLGDHFLLIGDSTDPQVVADLMQGDKFACVFTDPPYGVKYDHTAVHPERQRKWKEIENDELDDDGLEDFCRGFLGNLFRFGVENWVGYICFANKTEQTLKAAIKSLNIRLAPVPIIWVKQQFLLNWDKYHPQHEIITYCGPGTAAKGELSRWHGEKNETTIWNVNRDASKEYVHPTQKPVELPERAFRNSTEVGEIVLDLFGGSGSSMVAAALNKRKARLVELDPGYAALILERVAPLVENDVEKVERMTFEVPPGPERWSSRYFRLADEQAAIVDLALRAIAKNIKGENAEARALEMLAADFLAGHPEAVLKE